MFYLFVYIFNVCSVHPSPSPAPRRSLVTRSDVHFNITNYKVELNYSIFSQICVFCFAIITMLWLMFLYICNNVRYVCFTTNLNLLTKKLTHIPLNVFPIFLSFFVLELLLEPEENQVVHLFIYLNPNFGSLIDLLFKFSKIASSSIFTIVCLYIISLAITPVGFILSLVVFQIWTFSLSRNLSYWVPLLLILMSNDIHFNPGPQPLFLHNCFNFMNWNLNSLTKDNFHRVDILEAHNSIFNYDLISVCKTN